RESPCGTSIEPPLPHVAHRVVVRALPRLPRLFLAEVRRAEGGIAARIGGAPEADLVPRPGVGVEGLHDVAHHDRPGARLVHRLPDAAAQLRPREAVDDPGLRLHRRVGNESNDMSRAASSRPRATRRHTSPSSGTSWCCHPSPTPAASFSSTYESTGIRGSPSWAVATSQNAFSVRASASSKKRTGGTRST